MLVVDPGMHSLVQDLGRPGLAHLGVGVSGAADRTSMREANERVGNPADAAVIETVGGGLTLEAVTHQWCSVAGAPTVVSVDGARVENPSWISLRPGRRLRLAAPAHGLRTYVAVRGGIDVAAVLGSRSRDTLAGIGPEPLAAGDTVPVGPLLDAPLVRSAHLRRTWREATVTLRVVLGPHDDEVPDASALLRGLWTATTTLTRVALRLERAPAGAVGTAGHEDALSWSGGEDRDSVGLVRGSVQVPPSGVPVVFLADAPVTGGYPVIAVVVDDDVDRAAQVAPGQQVAFTRVPPPWS